MQLISGELNLYYLILFNIILLILMPRDITGYLHMIVFPKNSTKPEGSSVSMDCRVFPHYDVTVTWSFNNQSLISSRTSWSSLSSLNYLSSSFVTPSHSTSSSSSSSSSSSTHLPKHRLYDNGTLSLTRLSRRDAGEYRCEATNGQSTLTSVAHLNVTCEWIDDELFTN